ncbi:hypothetical protein NIES4106_61150 (plasmid) [Fischerella sp. NIES-4106]|nr:hypothetical protein NIES4106_61150 [Fischerella sp. NIES-4106]
MATTKQKIPSHTKKGSPKTKKQKKLDTAIVSHSATRRNTPNTKKECQLSRQERFKVAVANKELTTCLKILENAGFTGNTAIFMLGYFQQGEVAA